MRVIEKREAIARWVDMIEDGGGIEDAIADLRTRLGLRPDETEDSVCRVICEAADWRREDCGRLAGALLTLKNGDPI